ncbi:MAG: alpha/beta fold hydrolase [Actinomycetia bacterium]|nr:alpha/beta fold hydrolase [Actinomycetes bacterium]
MIALHGFSLTGEHFAPAAGLLDRTIIAPDLPGHGSSTGHPTDVDSVLASIEALVATPGAPRPVIGYSQGARLALLTAVEDPSDISSLVLVSGNAGIRDPGERHARAIADIEWAERIELIGLDTFLDSWTSVGIASVSHLSEEYRIWDRSVRAGNSAAGLASAIRGYGQGAQPSVWTEIGNLRMPVLLIAGSRDERYTSINEEMAGLIPNAEFTVIGDAGHNPLADQSETAYGAVSAFLDRNS